MGNQLQSCTRGEQDHSSSPWGEDLGGGLCSRHGGCSWRRGQDIAGCDPAGAVFDDTLQHLLSLDRSALRFAGSANLAALRWLLKFGADIGASDSNGTTLIHAACRAGSIQVVRDLVGRKLKLNTPDNAGWTALHVACLMGRRDVALALLQAGASTSCATAKGITPEELCPDPATKEAVMTHGGRCAPAGGDRGYAGSPPREPFVGSSSPSRPSARGFGGGAPELGPGLRFEPCFVPRDPVLYEPRQRDELQQLGMEIFSKGAGEGVAFLVAAGIARDYPVEINNFLVRTGADPARLGEFLGEDHPLAQNLRLEILNSMPLLGTGVVSALTAAFKDLAVPSDFLHADRLARGVAHFWWLQHEEEMNERKAEGSVGTTKDLPGAGVAGEVRGFELQRCLQSDEVLHGLMFSTLMLRRWFHAGLQMTMNEWTQLNAGVEGGGDVPLGVQQGIYAALAEGRMLLLEGAGAEPLPDQGAAPAVAGWARIRYDGRSQASHNGNRSAWVTATPSVLAAQGGIASVGRVGPGPGGLGRSSPVPAPQAARGPRPLPAIATGAAASGGAAAVTGEEETEGPQTSTEGEEVAWLSLHRWLLLFSPPSGGASARPRPCDGPPKAPPYAFASLRRAALKEVDPVRRRLVLAGYTDPSLPRVLAQDDRWLELTLLLGDGRFQCMEAPCLELTLERQEDFEAWAAHLQALCDEGRGAGHPTGPRLSSSSKPRAPSGYVEEEETPSPDRLGTPRLERERALPAVVEEGSDVDAEWRAEDSPAPPVQVAPRTQAPGAPAASRGATVHATL